MTGTERVRAYYESLNTGDAAAVSAHFTDDATHYYTSLGPHEGAKTIGDMTALGVSTIDAQWYIENLIEADGEVAIEWTMTSSDPKSGEPRLDRGTEWFRFRDDRIAEVRAYHHGGRKNPQGDLLGFDHETRGYRMLSDWEAPASKEGSA